MSLLNYNEDTENDLISIPVPLVNSTEPYEEELANELFENEIKKKSIKFIPWSELNDISKLDEGHFGFIFKAYWTKTHNNVICKALINLKDISGKYYTAFIHELTMHTRTDLCENIVRFLGATPELLKPTKSNNVPYCKKTDIYSLGMIFWELSKDIIPGTPEEYINLYNKCWDADPYERPDIEYVHKLLEGITKIWSNVSYITNDPEDNTSPQTSSEQSRLTIEINATARSSHFDHTSNGPLKEIDNQHIV
ncbi:30514_t:CDS:2 [Gigaspora margarita]|uniref:30514_t:CDS:1 n=1 Tax=Gigaspora margarita TaxID=4874 RepID=A0ABM8W6Y6_GIGMA|nr:30514_t:CDS:2 [Gigaspora margarita]